MNIEMNEELKKNLEQSEESVRTELKSELQEIATKADIVRRTVFTPEKITNKSFLSKREREMDEKPNYYQTLVDYFTNVGSDGCDDIRGTFQILNELRNKGVTVADVQKIDDFIKNYEKKKELDKYLRKSGKPASIEDIPISELSKLPDEAITEIITLLVRDNLGVIEEIVEQVKFEKYKLKTQSEVEEVLKQQNKRNELLEEMQPGEFLPQVLPEEPIQMIKDFSIDTFLAGMNQMQRLE